MSLRIVKTKRPPAQETFDGSAAPNCCSVAIAAYTAAHPDNGQAQTKNRGCKATRTKRGQIQRVEATAGNPRKTLSQCISVHTLTWLIGQRYGGWGGWQHFTFNHAV